MCLHPFTPSLWVHLWVHEWFKNGVEAALLAPTALNKQAFTIKGVGNEVSITYGPGTFSGRTSGW